MGDPSRLFTPLVASSTTTAMLMCSVDEEKATRSIQETDSTIVSTYTRMLVGSSYSHHSSHTGLIERYALQYSQEESIFAKRRIQIKIVEDIYHTGGWFLKLDRRTDSYRTLTFDDSRQKVAHSLQYQRRKMVKTTSISSPTKSPVPKKHRSPTKVVVERQNPSIKKAQQARLESERCQATCRTKCLPTRANAFANQGSATNKTSQARFVGDLDPTERPPPKLTHSTFTCDAMSLDDPSYSALFQDFARTTGTDSFLSSIEKDSDWDVATTEIEQLHKPKTPMISPDHRSILTSDESTCSWMDEYFQDL